MDLDYNVRQAGKTFIQTHRWFKQMFTIYERKYFTPFYTLKLLKLDNHEFSSLYGLRLVAWKSLNFSLHNIALFEFGRHQMMPHFIPAYNGHGIYERPVWRLNKGCFN